MNIEHITREVVKELMGEMMLQQGPQSSAVPHKRMLILLNRSDLPLADILGELESWQQKASLNLMAPRWARSVWPSSRAALDAVSFVSFDAADTVKSAKSLVSSHDRVVILGASRPLMQKLKAMNRQYLPSALAVEALQQNKPVMLLDTHWDGIDTQKLEAMGIRLGDLRELSRIFPLPPTPVLPPTPAQQPAPQKGGPIISNERIRQVMAMGAQRVGAALGDIHNVPQDIAGMIDHTLLKADSTEAQVRKLCAEAREYKFASVCVNPSNVPLAAELLKGCDVMVCTVVGFPLGATDSQTKADETRNAIAAGADEIDMVINVGALKSQNAAKVEADIRAVVQAARGKTVKVILETALLNDAEKVLACQLSEKAGAHFVKTSTGFGPSGATEADVSLMRRTVRPGMEVKASGGIRDQEKALKMIKAGATRIGASASIAIARGDAPTQSKEKY